MQADRWRRIEHIYHAALDHDEAGRVGYLALACDGDPLLQIEVISLLAEDAGATTFLETPALELVRTAGVSAAETAFDPCGKTISHYEVVEQLGHGGMGVVFRARDVRLGRNVVLKFLPERLSCDAEALQRFQGEARAASALNHPNICTVHDIGEHEGRPFIVMELLEGTTLEQRIDGRSLNESELLEIAMHIADALDAAHAKGIIHRDVKPANVFITAGGQVKVLDFGLAKLAGRDLERHLPADLNTTMADDPVPIVTANGFAVGTLPYMAPEQWRGETADARSDVYAVGVLLFEMATGERPFRGELAREVIDAVLHEPVEHPVRRNRSLSAALDQVIVRCLAKDPVERYASASELRDALKDVALRRPELARRTVIAASTVVVLAAIIATTLPFWKNGPASAPVPPIRSLAVLPLANLSGDARQDYFADGMTEQLISELSAIRSIRVISRTSAMRYRRTTKSVPEIARELHVDGIVKGSLSRSGSRVRVTAQLIDGTSNVQVWADSFERDLRDVLSLQSQVARAIANEIRATISPEDAKQLSAYRPIDPQAFESYLRGHYFSSLWTMTNLQKAIPYYRDAIAREPSFALAWAGLADTYSLMDHANGVMPMKPEDAYRRATEAAEKALSLDPDCVDAHAVLGHVLMHEGRYSEAGEHLERAVRLNPNSASARLWYGTLLLVEGRSEGFAQNEKARELDPLSPYVNIVTCTVAINGGNMDRAIEIARREIELAPQYTRMYVLLADACMYGGRLREAGETLDRAERLADRPPELDEQRATLFALANQRSNARSLLEKILREKKHPSARRIAFTYAALGETDQAMDWLERFARESPHFARLTLDFPAHPAFDASRSSARYTALFKSMGRTRHPQMVR